MILHFLKVYIDDIIDQDYLIAQAQEHFIKDTKLSINNSGFKMIELLLTIC